MLGNLTCSINFFVHFCLTKSVPLYFIWRNSLVAKNLLCIEDNYMMIWFALQLSVHVWTKFQSSLTSCSNKRSEIFVGYLSSNFATFLVHFTLMMTKILLVVASPRAGFILKHENGVRLVCLHLYSIIIVDVEIVASFSSACCSLSFLPACISLTKETINLIYDFYSNIKYWLFKIQEMSFLVVQ